jgi:prolipoprotein diacylglyceryltransferase
MKQALGWVWMGGVIAAIIAVQAFQRSEPLASMDRLLNGAHPMVPLGIAIAIIGAGLLLGALRTPPKTLSWRI